MLLDWNSSSACNLHSTQAVVYHSCRYWKTVSLFFVYVCLQVAIYTANWCTFKLNFEKISYVISKKVFLIFGEREISCPKIKKIQEGTFHAWKIKKSTLKKFPTYQEMELSSPKLKKLLHFFFFKSYISGGTLQNLKNKSFLYFEKRNSLAPRLKRFLYLIFFIRIFFITVFSFKIIRRNF